MTTGKSGKNKVSESVLSFQNDEKKIEILKHFMDENRRQVEWVKNLDYKATYSCLIFILISIGWVLTHDIGAFPKLALNIMFLAIPIFGIVMLLRNHFRNSDLNKQWVEAAIGLKLNLAGEYTTGTVFEAKNKNQFAYHLGRLIYVFLLAISAGVSIYLVNISGVHAMNKSTSENVIKVKEIDIGGLAIDEIRMKNEINSIKKQP